mmetsp:Transcript_47727/g.119254  ORF Transcript_47727/g.119254 Transcript_47727/m.119254 type:complete len:445 (+) Transcript_47727:24-1358(+)
MARNGGVLLVLVLCLAPHCGSVTPAFCPTWNPMHTECPLASDVLEKLAFSLEHEVAGQTLAARAIEKAMARNVHRCMHAADSSLAKVYGAMSEASLLKIYESATDAAVTVGQSVMSLPQSLEKLSAELFKATTHDGKPRPLFMHFSGPTGVGKTHTADIVARSVLARPLTDQGEHRPDRELCGKMSVQMRSFVSDAPADVEANARELRAKVAEQLYHCPRSVLIFDEIQSVPEDLVDVVIDMFDPDSPSPLAHTATAARVVDVRHAVNTSLCIVIAISDLGSTKLSPSMGREEAKRAIQEEADGRFLRSSKQALLQNIVPFLPLSVEELQTVAVMELKSLSSSLAREYRGIWAGKITWSGDVTRHIAARCRQDATCYDDGGRGVETYVEHELLAVCEDILAGEFALSDSVSYDNLDLYLEGEGDKRHVAVRVDKVFADNEFKEL